MKVDVKILDVNMVRRFGKTRVQMEQDLAEKYSTLGKVKIMNEIVKKKETEQETTNEVWEPPDKKIFSKPENDIFEDGLFPKNLL